MVALDNDIDELAKLKNVRYGYIPQERWCDTVVACVTEKLPGDGVLPAQWKYVNKDFFLNKYAHLGPVLWAKTASFHLLILNGYRLCRIWTNTQKTCWVDVNDPVANQMCSVEDIPGSCLKKSIPLTKRISFDNRLDYPWAEDLCETIKSIYGI